jgi:hypothetical protein
MATHIQQLAAMNDYKQLSIVKAGQPPKKLVPPHIEALTPYQPGRPPEDLKKELGLDRIINLASNENPLGPPASAVAAIENCLTEISRYPDMSGLQMSQLDRAPKASWQISSAHFFTVMMKF